MKLPFFFIMLLEIPEHREKARQMFRNYEFSRFMNQYMTSSEVKDLVFDRPDSYGWRSFYIYFHQLYPDFKCPDIPETMGEENELQ